MGIVLGGFALIFKVVLPSSDDGPPESLGDSLWNTYLLTTLGEFDSEIFAESPGIQFFFVAITFLVNVVMLNLLISFTGQGYDNAMEARESLGHAERIKAVCDLEASFLWLCSRRATRRGIPCRLWWYPRLLIRFSLGRGQDSLELTVDVPAEEEKPS